MAVPYIGEIRLFAGNFAPAGWAFCNGAVLAIAENEVLFNLIGTTYGGDGQSTFALPNLQSRVPIHQGQGTGLSNYLLAETGGVEQVTLTVQQIPLHNHGAGCKNGAGDSAAPANSVPAANTTALAYGAIPPQQNMNATIIGAAGGSQPHENVQPFLCVSFIISLFGVFPSPT